MCGQLSALKESRDHWLENRAEVNVALTSGEDLYNTGFSIGADDCACCRYWRCAMFDNGPRPTCEGCPIAEYTGGKLCQKTPYTKIDESVYLHGVGCSGLTRDDIDLHGLQKQVQEMIDLLDKIIKWLEDGKPTRGNNGTAD